MLVGAYAGRVKVAQNVDTESMIHGIMCAAMWQDRIIDYNQFRLQISVLIEERIRFTGNREINGL